MPALISDLNKRQTMLHLQHIRKSNSQKDREKRIWERK